jgi:small conductance mechanosensitive channel
VVCGWVYEHTGGNGALAATADWLVGRPLAIVGILVAGWLLRLVIRRLVSRGVTRILAREPILAAPAPAPAPAGPLDGGRPVQGGVPSRESARRRTRAGAVSAAGASFLSTLVWVAVVLAVCGVLGVDLGPLIAGAGLAGIALAFGAQRLIRDLLAGIFILLEDHFAIGDEVDLGEAVGIVEKMTFRETVLRDLDGTVWHVSNGAIDRVGNHSQVWSGAMVDVAVAHGTDLLFARNLLHEIASTVSADATFADDVLEPPELLGVERIDPDGITLRLRVKTRAGRQFALQRALLERVTVDFAARGVQLATPRLTLRTPRRPHEPGEGGAPGPRGGDDGIVATDGRPDPGYT